MASKIIFCFMIGFLGFLPEITKATEYWVGGEKGWTLDVDYQAWAKDKTFKVGDTLGIINCTHSHFQPSHLDN